MRRALVYKILLLLGGTVVALILAEVALRVIAARAPAWLFNEYQEPFWELEFIQEYGGDRRADARLHTSHLTRGWAPGPNRSVTCDNWTYTTNDRGHRATAPFVSRPDKYTVLIVGDSFTFGWEASHADTWPTILAETDDRLQVLNLGVPGYGVDQMCITLEESILEYRPQLVIFAYIGDDLDRSLLSFRHYRKPRFVLEGDDLKLTNTPIGTFPQTLDELRRKYSLPNLMTYCFLREFIIHAATSSQDRKERAFLLSERIVERAVAATRKHGSDFLLVHLVWGEGINDPIPDDQGEEFLTHFTSRHDVAYLATRQTFLEKGNNWVDGHYQRPESEVVARAVYEKIASLA
ncbi:MAG: SGNH/GDSL hydrolase family protein, partial [Planctomycetota bacterium]